MKRHPEQDAHEGQLSSVLFELDHPLQEGDLVRVEVLARVSAVRVGRKRVHVLKALEAGAR